MFIADKSPDLILLTEVIPKAQSKPIPEALLALSDYSMYCNFNPQDSSLGSSGMRGISIYVHKSLQATEINFGHIPFSEQLWIDLALSAPDKLLIGCLYRSPSGDATASVQMLDHLIHHVTSLNYSHILLAGDFNLPQINWEMGISSAPPNHISHAFVEVIQDCFLHQHVSEPTRFRIGEVPSTLDLIFSNEEGMV